MRHFIVLALSLLAVSQLEAKFTHLKPGKQYVYDYYGHYLASIANNGNRQVGMGLTGKVIVQVNAPDQCVFKLQQMKTAKLNEDIYEIDEDTLPWQFQDVQGPLASHIHKPIKVHWNNGKVSSLEASGDEPFESLNIKKAILSLYQISSDAFIPSLSLSNSWQSSLPSSARLHQNNMLNNRYMDQLNETNCYRTMEKGINGECRSYYLVDSLPSPENPDAEVFNITKYRDPYHCTDRPFWVRSTHVPNECVNCDADDDEPFTTVYSTDYDIRKRGDELVIEQIEAEAQTVFAPYTTNSDYFMANHSQILSLVHVSQIGSSEAVPVNAKTFSTLRYKFPTAKRALQQGPAESLKRAQVPFFLDRKPNVVPQAVKLMQEVIREITDEATNARYLEDTPLKVYKVVSDIRLMDKDELAQFYQEACASERQSQTVSPKDVKQMCVDALVMAGTNPSIIMVRYLIESKKITGEMAVQAVQAMPTNIYEPTNVILEEILKLAKSPVAQEYKQLRKTAWLSFAILVSKACDGPEDDIPTVPEAPHLSPYCPQEIERKYIQELANKLHNARTKGETLLTLRALGLTELPTAIEAIRPYAEGDAAEDDSVQKCALHSLRTIAKYAPEEVMDIAEDEFYDTENPNGVRIAALRAMMSSQPDTTDLQRVVAWAQKEPSDDVKGYIYSFFDSISNATHYCLKDIANDADELMAFLDEDDENGIQASNVWESSQEFDDLGMSTQTYLSWTASNSSIFPETILGRINNTIAGVSYKPFVFAMNIKGLSTIMNRLVGPSGSFSKFHSIEDIFRPEGEMQDKQRTFINSKLNLDTREQEPFELSAFFKLADTQARMFYLDYKSIVNYIKSGAMPHGLSLSDLRSGIPIHYHKLTLFHEVQMQTPSILGVPMVLNMITPAIFSLKGKVAARFDMSSSSSMFPGRVEFEIDARPSILSKKRISLGVYNPFEKEVSAAVLATSTYIAPPISMKADINILQGKMKMDLKPSTSAYQTSSEAPKIFYYRVKPYSMHCSLVKLDDYCSSNAKIIHATPVPKIRDLDFSQNIFGIPLIVKTRSENDWDMRAAFFDWFDDFDSVITFLNTWWATPEFAARNYGIYLKSGSSQGKEIEFSVEWEYTPTPVERIVYQSKRSPIGFWPIVAGFAKLPQRCGSKGSGHFDSEGENEPWYLGFGSRRHTKKDYDEQMHGRYDDDYDSDSVLGSFYSSFKNRTMSAMSYPSKMFKSPWWYDTENQKPSSYNDDDDDDDASQVLAGQSRLPYTSQTRSHGAISIQKVSTSNEVSVLTLKLRAVAKGSSSAITSNIALKRNWDTFTDIVSVTTNAANIPYFNTQDLQMCLSATVQYPEVPCDYHSLMSTRAAQPINADVKFSWGQSQCSPSQHVAIKALFKKSDEQLAVESHKDEWYFEQCQKDISEGKKLTEACEIAQLEFSSLNKMVLDVEYSKLPKWFANITYWADNYLKATFYNQMSNNPVDVHNGEGRLKIVAVLRDEVESLDLKLFKPRENTFFKKIYLADTIPYFYPISTQTPIWEQFYDDITDGMATPSCKVMGNYVNTFDNTTYRYRMPANCEHVFAKDCSPDDLFAVTVANVGNGLKKVNFYLLSHKISIKPQARYSGNFVVSVNDDRSFNPTYQEAILIKSDGEAASGQVIAIITVTGPSIHVLAPMHGLQLEFDGEDAELTVSGLWANRVCGLCGQYDGESDYDDFIGPRQCTYPGPISFGLSYALPGPQCQMPSPPNPNKMCDSDSSYTPRSGSRYGPNYDNDEDDDDENMKSSQSRMYDESRRY